MICHLKATPSSLWDCMHLSQPFFFALGEILSEELGTWKKKYMLYNHQHKYFFPTEPPALLPLYFHWHIFYFIIQQKNWVDLPEWWLSIPVSSHLGGILWTKRLSGLFFMVSSLESNWFVWVTQMKYIPMYNDNDWKSGLGLHLAPRTCNVCMSAFRD